MKPKMYNRDRREYARKDIFHIYTSGNSFFPSLLYKCIARTGHDSAPARIVSSSSWSNVSVTYAKFCSSILKLKAATRLQEAAPMQAGRSTTTRRIYPCDRTPCEISSGKSSGIATSNLLSNCSDIVDFLKKAILPARDGF